MPRRRVTMLEAFQASARKSALEAASEKRRAADEREREAKRADSRRTTQLWLGRLGDGVGSLWSGLRGDDTPSDVEPAAARDEAVVPFDRRPPPPAHEPQVESTPEEAPSPSAGTVSGGTVSGGTVEPEHGESADSDPVSHESGAEDLAVPAAADAGLPGAVEDAAAALEDADHFERRAEREAVEAALRTAAEETFGLPISGRVFAALVALLIAIVFALGFRLGNGGEPAIAAGPGAAGVGSNDPGRQALDRIELSAPGPSFAAAPRVGIPSPSGRASVPATSNPVAPAGAAPEPTSPADAAFDDRRNRYSILAVTYAATRTNEQLAWEAYDQLVAAGLPAVSPVLDSADRKIFLFVGAAEAEAELVTLLNRVKAVEAGPRRRRDFMSAWVVLIDHYR